MLASGYITERMPPITRTRLSQFSPRLRQQYDTTTRYSQLRDTARCVGNFSTITNKVRLLSPRYRRRRYAYVNVGIHLYSYSKYVGIRVYCILVYQKPVVIEGKGAVVRCSQTYADYKYLPNYRIHLGRRLITITIYFR